MYLTHDDLSKYWVIDIETDDLNATKIWCVVLQNVATKELLTYGPSDLARFSDWCRDHGDCVLVGHNALSFDVPVINHLLGVDWPLARVVDTLVLSYLYDPRMPGPEGAKRKPHSLKAWGIRLRLFKGDFDDFSHYSPEMLEYCIGDVATTLLLFVRLSGRMAARGFSEQSCAIEHQIRIVVNGQQDNGFYFDVEAACELALRLRDKQRDLSSTIEQVFPAELVRTKSYKYRTRRDGVPVASYLRHCETAERIDWDEDGLTYHVCESKSFNIGSPKQRIDKLLSLGWVPQKYTKAGNPQVDEESLLDFFETSKRPEIKAIADWLVLQGRATMVEGWIRATSGDSRIHGRVFTCGAGTRRMKHNSPNTANIPKAKAKVPYGIECRSLWTVADRGTRRLVGYDAAGLEMRCFAHYLNNPKAFELYTTGDPHQFNADLLGIERDPVKNVFYAFIYGAANAKLGWTGNTSLVSEREQVKFGKFIRGKLVEFTPGLKELTELIGAEGEWLQTIDGGYVRCFDQHARINYKLQSAGAIVMKQTSIFIHERIKEKGYDALKVGDIHDEGQIDCEAGCAQEVGKLCIQALQDAGEELGFRVPITGSYAIGLSWAETH